jgi:hypothetical protein
MLPLHRSAWQQHPAGVVKYDLIDDGSPTPIAEDFRFDGLQVYRVLQDIPWNVAGARNLGFHVATSDWVLSADIDHVVTADALARILRLDLSDPNRVYTFSRQTQAGLTGRIAVINILMNKGRFFEIGGYDEDFSGHYGVEDTFFSRCLRHAKVQIIKCEDIALEWHPKAGGTHGLLRDKSINAQIFSAKAAQLKEQSYKNGRLLRFDWASRAI